MMPIEQGQEILISYKATSEFYYASRDVRRQQLLDTFGFLCDCSECSLGGEDLEENERIRVELRETDDKMEPLVASIDGLGRRDLKKLMKLAQQRLNLMKKLNIRAEFVDEQVMFYYLAVRGRAMDIRCSSDPDAFKQEVWKYAEMFGDNYIHLYNGFTGN